MKKLVTLVVVLACALFAPSLGAAAPLTFWSGDGGDILVNSVNPGAITQIAPHAAWGDVSDNAGLAAGTAKWISYANTGVGGIIAPNAPGRNIGQETFHVRRSFSLTDFGSFDFWILGDDTATVTLTGPGGTQTLFSAFLGQIDPCAPGGTGVPIGCVEADMGFKSVMNLMAGNYDVDIYTFQTNNDVHGTQFAAEINQVPEPGSMILLGSGLCALAAGARKKYINGADAKPTAQPVV